MLRYTVLFQILLLPINAFSVQRPILIITTDVGQDPDDQQSMVRLLHYADKFHIAGIIANADANYAHEPPIIKDHIIHELIDAYGEIEHNLRVHSPDFPSAKYLHSIVKKGCAGNGKTVPIDTYIGNGKDTEGSEWIIRKVDNTHYECIHVSVWGGACDLAQALWKVKNTRTILEQNRFIEKLRVFFIGKQDSSNQWIIDTFPSMWLILSYHPGGDSWQSAYRGMFLGGDITLTSREWLSKHVVGRNSLGTLYPDQAFTGKMNSYGAMKEGDSPAFMFFIENGLNNSKNPEWGGWGGRYILERDSFFRDSPDAVADSGSGSVTPSSIASVFRWRADFQRDFAARVQWGSASAYQNANHYPIIAIEGYPGRKFIELSVRPGDNVTIDASNSFDPDGDQLMFEWFPYHEAGTPLLSETNLVIVDQNTSKVSVKIPETAKPETIHLILRVTDRNQHPLAAYCRILFAIQ